MLLDRCAFFFADHNRHYWQEVADSLTPGLEWAKKPFIHRFFQLLYNFPLALITSGALKLTRIFMFRKKGDPRQDFSLISQDSRNWQELGSLRNQTLLLEEHHLIGPGSCTYQDSGYHSCPDSQWATYEKKKLSIEKQSKSSANLYEYYKTPEGRHEIVERLQKLGSNTYRFSVEWSQIEPVEGEYKKEPLQVYIDLCRSLRDANIRPVVTLLHFSEPNWWYLAGSFEKEENIPAFIRFASFVYEALTKDYKGKPLVDIFCTINEPAIDAFSRYIRGAFPPEMVMDFKKAARFLHGALRAHQTLYKTLKTRDDIELGIVHQRLAFEARTGMFSPVTHYLTYFVNEVSLEYFNTGRFEVKIPFMCNILIHDEKPVTDFVGLQYYVRPLLGFSGSRGRHEAMTAMPFREDPAGIFDAILEVYKAYRKPILITNNGISTHDETQRYRYMERALYAVQKAVDQIGKENFKGYIVWSFCKNAEWNMGMEPQDFGIFPLTQGTHGNWILGKDPKSGIKPLIRIAKDWQKRYGNDSHEQRAVGNF